MQWTTLALLTTMGFGAAGLGCANTPPPNDQWAAAQRVVGEAQASGAPTVPEARLHLQLSFEDLQKAKELMGHDNDHAASLCSLAAAEAQLAMSLTKESQAQQQAKTVPVSPNVGQNNSGQNVR